MTLWRIKNLQAAYEKYGVQEKKGDVYIFNREDEVYDNWEGEYKVDQWVLASEEDIIDLDKMI